MTDQAPKTLKWGEQMLRVDNTYIDEANWGNAERSGSCFIYEEGRGLEIETRRGEAVLLTPKDHVVLGHNGSAYSAHTTVADLFKGHEDAFVSQVELMEIINYEAHFAKACIEKTARLVNQIRGENLFGYDLEQWINDSVRQAYHEDDHFDVQHLVNVLLRKLLRDPYGDEAQANAAVIQNFLMEQGFFDLTDEVGEAEQEHGEDWVIFLVYTQSSKQNAIKAAELVRSSPDTRALLNPGFLKVT